MARPDGWAIPRDKGTPIQIQAGRTNRGRGHEEGCTDRFLSQVAFQSIVLVQPGGPNSDHGLVAMVVFPELGVPFDRVVQSVDPETRLVTRL